MPTLKKLSIKNGNARQRLKRLLKPKPPKKVKPSKIFLTLGKLLRAIEGSNGIKSTIAMRLGCSYNAVHSAISKSIPAQEALSDEIEKMGDLAEEAVKHAIQQRLDISTSARTALQYLERRHKNRGYGEHKTLTVEGGDKPIQVQQNFVPIESLPLDIRIQIMNALERQEALKDVTPENLALPIPVEEKEE